VTTLARDDDDTRDAIAYRERNESVRNVRKGGDGNEPLQAWAYTEQMEMA
jgi:hypothetical protein